MATSAATSCVSTMTMITTTVYLLLLFPIVIMGQDYDPITPYSRSNVPKADKNILEFALNLEYLEAEFFLYGSTGKGLDHIQPGLAGGGPPPMGARMARLTPLLRNIITQFAFQEVGHLRAIKGKIGGGIPRPLMDLSSKSFAITISKAFGRPLIPPFDPYANDINYMLASYMIPYVGLTGYVGANPKLQSSTAKQLVAGLLGVESGQDAVLRTLLYNRGAEKVAPYGITVAEFTDRISGLRNKLGHAGLKDKGLIVPVTLGVEGKMPGNLLIADTDSLSYGRKPPEILRIVYGSGKEQVPGGFFPSGANGTIAKKYLKSSKY